MSGDRVFRRVWTRALLFVFHSWGHPHWVDERNKRRRRRRGKKGKNNTTGERRARLLQLQCTSQWWQTTMTMRTKTTMTLSLVRMDGHFDFSSLFTRVHVVDDDLFPPQNFRYLYWQKTFPIWWVANILTFTSMTPSPQDKSLRYPFWWNGVYTKSLGFPTQDPKNT